MNERENTLRAARFERPERIPTRFSISGACWHHYDNGALLDLMAAHPLLFPGFDPADWEIPVRPQHAPFRTAGVRYVDSWGCTWETVEDGITGAVVQHALPTWDDFDAWQPPDPAKSDGWQPIDWDDIGRGLERARAEGRLARGGLRHGHTFLTLTYIRGYSNAILDMADDDPRVRRLLGIIERFNAGLVERYLERGVEWMGYPEDLGMQSGPMLSPAQFREYILPIYRRLTRPALDAGCVLHMHSDGDIRTLAGDLLDCGLHVLNLQDLVNGIDWIRDNLKGRACIDLDVDRQAVVRYGTPGQIDAHIRNAVAQLGSREGGLMMVHGLYPGVPLQNVEALMDAMETYSTYWS